MPHGSGGGDDFASTDEVKVYKEEGEEENKSSAEILSEEKLGLLTETEQGKSLTHSSVGSCCSVSDSQRSGFSGCLADYYSFHGRIPFGYHPLLNTCPYASGTAAITGLNNVPIFPSSPWFYMCNNEHFNAGSRSHIGLPPPPPPPLHIGSHGGYSPASSMYHLHGMAPSHHLSHLFVPNEFSPISCFDHFSRSSHALYPMTFGSSYLPPVIPGNPLSGLNARNYFSSQPSSASASHYYQHHPSHPPPPNIPCPGISHPALVSTAKEDGQPSCESVDGSSLQSVWYPSGHSSDPSKSNMASGKLTDSTMSSSACKAQRRSHIKKPLNAFMLFMKEMRSKVVDECTLKESAAINQILGRKWHSLEQSEQNKYYEMARKEKLLHRQMFPGWSARDNYATQIRKKRKREQMRQLNQRVMTREEEKDTSTSKKCRARYGLDQQHRWCKPCRRKKRCIKFLDDDDGLAAADIEEDNSSQIPAADSTVNESHLFSMTPSVGASSTLDADCLVSESGAPASSQSMSTSGQSNMTCDDFPAKYQNCRKRSFTSWNDAASSSTSSPLQQFSESGRMKQPHDSSRHTSHISSTIRLAAS